MFPTILTALGLGLQSLSFPGQLILSTILASTLWIPGSFIFAGHQFIINDSSTTTTPGVYLNDETTAIKTWPTAPGVTHCEGNTGALLCTLMIKLTGSGGHRNSNAGSYLCETSTCSIVDTRLMVESGSDLIYGGWTLTPTSQSGVQLYNRKLVANKGTYIGSGAVVRGGTDLATITTTTKDVPPGATIKFQWDAGNSTEDYSRTKAAVLIRFYKFYTP